MSSRPEVADGLQRTCRHRVQCLGDADDGGAKAYQLITDIIQTSYTLRHHSSLDLRGIYLSLSFIRCRWRQPRGSPAVRALESLMDVWRSSSRCRRSSSLLTKAARERRRRIGLDVVRIVVLSRYTLISLPGFRSTTSRHFAGWS